MNTFEGEKEIINQEKIARVNRKADLKIAKALVAKHVENVEFLSHLNF